MRKTKQGTDATAPPSQLSTLNFQLPRKPKREYLIESSMHSPLRQIRSNAFFLRRHFHVSEYPDANFDPLQLIAIQKIHPKPTTQFFGHTPKTNE